MSTIENIDRTPPQNIEAEQWVLGALLVCKPDLRMDIFDVLEARHFYRPAHGEVFTAIKALHDRGEIPDTVAVGNRLERDGLLGRIGGGTYLHTLMQSCLNVFSAMQHAETVFGRYKLRRGNEAAVRAQEMTLGGGDGADADEILDRIRGSFDEIVNESCKTQEVSFAEEIDRYFAELGAESTPAISTGIPEVDEKLLGGIRPGKMTVIGARPGVGKSVVGINFATAAAKAGHGVFLASMEMSTQDCMNRIWASEGRIPHHLLVRGELDSFYATRQFNLQRRAEPWNLRINDSERQTVSSIRAGVRTMIRASERTGAARPRLVVVDYIQLMEATRRHDRRDLAIGEFTRGLRAMAKELDVHVVALSQVNRGSEQRQDKRPSLGELRESGNIEQDADTVILLHRDVVGLENPDGIELIFAKNRAGTPGTVELCWSGSQQRVHGADDRTPPWLDRPLHSVG